VFVLVLLFLFVVFIMDIVFVVLLC